MNLTFPCFRTKSLNDFDDMKQTISRLVRNHQLASSSCDEPNEDAVNNECHMNLLPQELIALILSFLSFSDQKECRLVCHAWLIALEVTDFYRHSCIMLNEDVLKKQEKLKTFATSSSPFHHFSLSNFSLFSNFSLCSESVSSSVFSLHLSDCEITEKELLLILSKLSNIKSLALINCRELFMTGTFLSNEEDRQCFRKSITSLEDLILDQNAYLSDILLLRIANSCTDIKYLR